MSSTRTSRPSPDVAPKLVDAAEPASPCIGVCQLQAGTDLCKGCWRTLAELGEWGSAGVDRRREILAAVASRRGAETATAGPETPTRRPPDSSTS